MNQQSLWLGKDVDGARNGFLYYHSGELQAVREGPWKLRLPDLKKKFTMKNADHGSGKIELYHLGNDLGEKTNLADKHPEIVERLMKIANTAKAE